MEKYFCFACLHSFYITNLEERRVEGKPQCPECGQSGSTPDIEYKGYVVEETFKVTRTWYVKAYHHQQAIDKAKNWDHDEISSSKISPEESYIL